MSGIKNVGEDIKMTARVTSRDLSLLIITAALLGLIFITALIALGNSSISMSREDLMLIFWLLQ
jgi:hypothetical protein